ncbi:MAG: amidohydrolase [Acidobacteria bacterium]|nr:MAG: amidohydrolase [Acidobacteriota bacterium]REJ98131.1 MAG: amidohydrolase [Acidobacteriota bacterium]REK16874.1 MAG: amidohydrolase [Acidobacteriota bacterium]REK42785.1 MAG: amidohydrolase [Acidobacteriota bacterium]
MKNSLPGRFVSAALCGLLLLTPIALPQDAKTEDEKNKKWDVLNPPFPLKTVRIKTEKTTWSSLDVTPDGERFVFDMLGDIYVADIDGGDAEPVLQDFAWNIHPAVSPDGKQIAFVSDRDGLTNLWVMDIDGKNLKQLSKEKKNIIHSPKWSPDGEYIVVNKGFMSSRSIPAGEIWMYHKTGGGGLVIKSRKGGRREQKNIADPAFSPDGKYIYYTEDITPGFIFSYNRDPLKSIFAITRYDIEKAEENRFISGTGGAIIPTPSPDGRYIAFIRRVRNKTALFLKDLETDLEWPIHLEMERDLQEGFGSEGYYAYFDWMPDSKSIVFWTGGNFHRISISDSSVKTIPVSVEAEKKFADAVRFDVDVAPDKFDVKMVRWAQRSPDGRSIIFQALGKIHVRDLSNNTTRRLTKQEDHDEFYPQFSLDGKSVIYTTWNDQDLGTVRIAPAAGGDGKVVSKGPGHYVEPAFSTDGKMFAYRKFSGGFLLTPKYSIDPGIYIAKTDGSGHKRVSTSGSDPHFAGDNSRVYFSTGVPGKDYPERQLASVNLNGDDRKEHVYGADDVEEFRLSHDGKWVAFTSQFNAYVAPIPPTGKLVSVGPDAKAIPVKKLSSRSGENLVWRADSQAVGWTHGPVFYERELKDAFDFIEGAPEKLPEPVASGTNLSISVDADKPSGYKAIVGGTVVTMRDADNTQEVIRDGVVLIRDNKIEAVGRRRDVKVPQGATVIDAKGKTVIPGLIDAHAHGGQGRNQIIPRQNWSMYSNVAFGVTTIHDPSNDTQEIFSAAEMQKAGMIVAPRIFSTGRILYGAESVGAKSIVNSYEDALYHVQRMKDSGAISVKSYNQPGRAQRQQILQAARELGMMVVPEGGGKLHQNITMLVDGHTGLEHSLPIAYGYDDLTELWGATKYGYTPTFVVSYGGLMGEEYWYGRTDVWKNERLMRYSPDFIIDPRAIRRETAPDDQYNHIDVAKYAKTLRDKGVGVHIGAHGQREGLGSHWELWIMSQGGFSPWEALRGGTIDGARHLGMDKHLGSIEPGKLADLVIIEGDVLLDIRRSEYVTHTVLNGRVYEAATMNEVGGRKRQPFFFEGTGSYYMPGETRQEMEQKAFEHRWVH